MDSIDLHNVSHVALTPRHVEDKISKRTNYRLRVTRAEGEPINITLYSDDNDLTFLVRGGNNE